MSLALRTCEFAELGHFMSDGAAGSLRLLRAIESTVRHVSAVTDQMLVFVKVVDGLNASLKNATTAFPEKDILPAFEEVQDALQDLHTRLRSNLKAAMNDQQLRDEDGVRDAYSAACRAVLEVHEGIEQLRWNLMQHNAEIDNSDPGETLTTEEGVRAFLAKL